MKGESLNNNKKIIVKFKKKNLSMMSLKIIQIIKVTKMIIFKNHVKMKKMNLKESLKKNLLKKTILKMKNNKIETKKIIMKMKKMII